MTDSIHPSARSLTLDNIMVPENEVIRVTPEMKLLTLIGEVTEPGRRNVYKRPDGSLTHW